MMTTFNAEPSFVLAYQREFGLLLRKPLVFKTACQVETSFPAIGLRITVESAKKTLQIEPADHSTAIFDHDTPVTSYNGQASDVSLMDLSNSAERTIGTTPEQSGLDLDNCLQLYFQSRTLRLPVPESCSSTETNNLTTDERLKLYSNPLYDPDNSNASPLRFCFLVAFQRLLRNLTHSTH